MTLSSSLSLAQAVCLADAEALVEPSPTQANNTALSELPLYMQGYSSGGTMCLKLPEYLRGTGSDLTVDGLIPNDVAPRGGFNAGRWGGSTVQRGAGGRAQPLICTPPVASGARRPLKQCNATRVDSGLPPSSFHVLPQRTTPTPPSSRRASTTRPPCLCSCRCLHCTLTLVLASALWPAQGHPLLLRH